MKTLLTSLTFCITALCTIQVNADANESDIYEGQKIDMSEMLSLGNSMAVTQLLAENTEEPLYGAQPEEPSSAPNSGDLIIPGESENKANEKKCVTVCDTWGEECVINPRTGRKCRRVCKSFGKECI